MYEDLDRLNHVGFKLGFVGSIDIPMKKLREMMEKVFDEVRKDPVDEKVEEQKEPIDEKEPVEESVEEKEEEKEKETPTK